MSLTMHFRSSRTTSALHAAFWLIEGGQLAQAKLQEALKQPANILHREMRGAGLARSANHAAAQSAYRFTDDVLALSATVTRPLDLARTAVIKATGADHRDSWESGFGVSFRKIQQAFDQVVTETDEQLALRGNPLRQAWETRGPGLVRGVSQLVEPQLLVDEVHATLVYPAAGGAGRAHPRANAITMEAMLADATAELPELVRLAWLATLLNIDLPKYQAHFSAVRARELTELAMLPITLQAAHGVELATCNQSTISLALNSWKFAAEKKAELPDIVWRWWETYRDTRPDWQIALAALDRMLSGTPT